MKITDIKFGMLRVPLKTPFKTALRTVDTVEDIVVIVHTDTGHVGYGEAPATAVITGDTHGAIVAAIALCMALPSPAPLARNPSRCNRRRTSWCAIPNSQPGSVLHRTRPVTPSTAS